MKFGGTMLFIFFFSSPASACQEPCIDMSDERKLIHPQPVLGVVSIEPAFEDYAFMLFDLCETLELECFVYPMMGNINNAVAFRNDRDSPIIVFDRRLSPKLGYEGATAVIAHELGHHYCQHLTNRNYVALHDAEKEADAFMGYAMQALGYPLSDTIRTFERLGIDRASKTHPDLIVRADAILSGFASGSLDEICPGAAIQ